MKKNNNPNYSSRKGAEEPSPAILPRNRNPLSPFIVGSVIATYHQNRPVVYVSGQFADDNGEPFGQNYRQGFWLHTVEGAEVSKNQLHNLFDLPFEVLLENLDAQAGKHLKGRIEKVDGYNNLSLYPESNNLLADRKDEFLSRIGKDNAAHLPAGAGELAASVT